MKTAMQLLLEKFDRMPEYLFATYLKVNRDGLLEKEKEQIIEAGNACGLKAIVYHQKLSEMSKDELIGEMVEDGMSYGEEYYKQTYKPETI